MDLPVLDLGIIAAYLVVTILLGLWVSKRASRDLDSYFLGGKTIPWYILGISNASGQFDITGTMLLVYWCFAYGLKSVWFPWVWPTFNQIFLMMYLATWLRRSNVLTGAEWIQTRFGRGRGANLAHISVVVFALITVIGFVAYEFQGIGKFAEIMLPWDLSPNTYALIILSITSIYVVKGGMHSVVLTELLQFALMTVVSITVGIIAIATVSPEAIDAVVPEGWRNLWFGWTMNMKWTGDFETIQVKMAEDGMSLFSIFFGLMVFKGVLASMAGPSPNYDMQRVLATRNQREASLMSATVNVVLYFPRYMLIAGLTVLALVPLRETLVQMWNAAVQAGEKPDFEKILPVVIQNSVIPTGLTGLLLAGLLAAFMSTFAATVNAGPAYVVNDIYKRFINPNASNKVQVRMSYVVSVLVVGIGILFGYQAKNIYNVTMWIVGGLFGGYVAANVLRWHWWRFNGYGFFWGLITGIAGALFVPSLVQRWWPGTNALYTFPPIFVLSIVGCLLGTFLSKPEDDEVLKSFYRTVRPWGFWGPIRAKVMAEDPTFRPNKDFRRDLFNIVIGTIWQTTFVILPICLVIRESKGIVIALVVLVVTSVVLKKSWYDHLPPAEPTVRQPAS
ncbi:MAG: Na+:solute symporter [Phycisphaerae bacterium]|nr:Na+:solute symporter [Phycisphaerae bacterium]